MKFDRAFSNRGGCVGSMIGCRDVNKESGMREKLLATYLTASREADPAIYVGGT